MDLDAAIGVLGGGKESAPARRAPNDLMQADSEAEAIYHIKSGLTKRAYIKGQMPDFSGGQEGDLDGAIAALSGGPTKAAAPVSVTPKVQPSAKAAEPSSALPDTTVGRIASGVLGEAKGAFDLAVEGPAQLLAHAAADIYPSNWPGAEFLQGQKEVAEKGRAARQQAFDAATVNTGTSAKVGEIAGGVIGAMALPQSKAAEGANLFNRMIAAAKTGGAIGLATPTEDKDFWTNKAIQTGLSAATAFLAQPIAEGVGKIIGGTVEAAAGIGRRVLNWATGKGEDKAVSEVMKSASPELKQAVQMMTAKGSKPDLAALGRQVEADSLPVKMSLTAGQARQDPHLISAELNTRSVNQAAAYKFQQQEKELFANLHAIREMAAPEATATDAISAGSQLIKSGEQTIEKQRQMTSALYKKLTDANGGSLPVDGTAFVDSAEAALKKQMKAPFLPAEVRQIMNGIKDEKGAMTFENFENLRTILASAGRTAERSGDGNKAAAISLVRDALENAPLSDGAAAVKPLADAARASAKFGFDMLRKNPALAAIDAGKAADNTFIQKYIVGGSKKDMENLAQAFAHDPQALQTIKAGTINYLEQAAGSGRGNLTQAGYNKAMQALGPKLDILFGPEEAVHLRTLGNVAKYTQLAPRGAYVNSSNTDVANLARQGGGMAARFVDRVIGAPVGSAAQTVAESVMDKRATAKTLGQIVNLGAGVAEPSNSSKFLLGTFPRAAGSAAAVPLSVMAGQRIAEERRQQSRKGN